jgi:hypothetical protein
VFDVDVHMSINPLTGKPFFMPFRQSSTAMMRISLAFLIFTLLLALGAIASGDRRALYRPANGGGGILSFRSAQFRP